MNKMITKKQKLIISEFIRWAAKNNYLYTFSELQKIDGWLTREELLLCGTPKDRSEFRRSTEDLFIEFQQYQTQKTVNTYNL